MTVVVDASAVVELLLSHKPAVNRKDVYGKTPLMNAVLGDHQHVIKVLQKHKATGDNVMLNVSFLSFLESIQLESTPAVLVYGVDGKLARRFDNDKVVKASDEFGMDDVAEFVQQLLKK